MTTPTQTTGSLLARARYVMDAPIAAIRPYLLFKLTLLLLAFDMWITRASHAGRYGAGGFNVAHWPWLDWVQPEISPPLYVGACVLTGTLCFVIVFANRPPRWLIGLAFLVHTWSWAMSMLDSYQHHYLLSIALFAMIFFPPMSAEEALRLDPKKPDAGPSSGEKKKAKRAPDGSAAKRVATDGETSKNKAPKRKKKRKKKSGAAAPQRTSTDAAAPDSDATREPRSSSTLIAPHPFVSAWGYLLFAGSTAIVYAYTAYSKTDPEWLSGAALRNVIHFPGAGQVPGENANLVVRVFYDLIEALGEDGPLFWYLMGHSVVLVQIVVMAGYLLAPWRDRLTSLASELYFAIALFTALSFHVGAELMGLQIGWFSYYMVAYALICFLPAELLVAVSRAVLWPRGEHYGIEAVVVRVGATIVGLAAASALEAPVLYWSTGLVLVGSLFRVLSRVTFLPRIELMPDFVPLLLAAVAALLHVAVGWAADLPGAREASVIAAVLLGVGVVYSLVRNGEARALHGYAFGLLVGSLALVASLVGSEVRWDYWRNVGGDHRRRHEYGPAYEAYVLANEYAPEGEDRDEQQEEMREALERERAQRGAP